MTKWEYVTVPLLVHATKQILDNWGDDGWELVTVIPGPNAEQLPVRYRHLAGDVHVRSVPQGRHVGGHRGRDRRQRQPERGQPPRCRPLAHCFSRFM